MDALYKQLKFLIENGGEETISKNFYKRAFCQSQNYENKMYLLWRGVGGTF